VLLATVIVYVERISSEALFTFGFFLKRSCHITRQAIINAQRNTLIPEQQF